MADDDVEDGEPVVVAEGADDVCATAAEAAAS
jgi:hypothetical protein